MAKTNATESIPSINFLSSGTIMKGDIKSNGDFRIDGILYGSINSKGKVVVGASGKVEGEIICQNSDISGEINAKIIVHELLSLKGSARLTGDIFAAKLAIEPGAIFTGLCSMNDIPKQEINISFKNDDTRKKEEATK